MSELCSAVRAVGREAEEDQVMLTSDGKQMDPADMIGAYSVGMVIASNGQIISPNSYRDIVHNYRRVSPSLSSIVATSPPPILPQHSQDFLEVCL